jgi:hypothetical protein
MVIPIFGQNTSSPISLNYLGSWHPAEKDTWKDPTSISIDPTGSVYISDTGNHRIQKWTLSGEIEREIGGFGWEKEQFHRPVAIRARNGLDVFVADYSNQRIERYDKDLNFIATFIATEDTPDHLLFGFPKDVDISSQGELFCLDGENQRILKLDVQGIPQLSFGDFDAGEGHLFDPSRILITKSGYLCVSDIQKKLIVIFDLYGNYVSRIGKGLLEEPRGLCETPQGYIAVADIVKRRIIILTLQGLHIPFEESVLPLFSMFEEPVDIACHKNSFYVLDRKKGTIDLFRIHYQGANLR